MKTTWVTFYSYKGGVGRTNALANVAGRLAKLGRRVVMIDFDLEAPGLDSYPEFSGGRKPGVVEYINRFLEDRKTPPIEHYVHRCPADVKVMGRLWLMPSGMRDEKYASRLHGIRWSELYESAIAAPLIANWKLAVERKFAPDYVLIDSRTGLTDIGGVCTLHFPDVNVLLLALNSQSIEGTSAVLRSISAASEARPIETLTIASPLPPMGAAELEQTLEGAGKRLGGRLAGNIAYNPAIAVGEHVWTLDDQPLAGVVTPFEVLTRAITQRARDGIDFFLSGIDEAFKSGDLERADEFATLLVEQYGHRLEALKVAVKLARSRKQVDRTIELLKKILELDPFDLDSFTGMVGALSQKGKQEELKAFLHQKSIGVEQSVDPRKLSLLMEIGHVYMQMNDHRSAANSYFLAQKCAPRGETTLSVSFNFLEAQRRHKGHVSDHEIAHWRELEMQARIAIDNAIQVGGSPQNFRAYQAANTFQALSTVYAIIGELDRARELLQRAERLARTMNPAVAIFSVTDYTYVGRDEFLRKNALMLEALSRRQLWDGMMLPGESSGQYRGHADPL